MYGWTGKSLRVNLSKSKISVEDTDPIVARDFIGGRGMGVKYLYNETDPEADALSTKNNLLMVTGPLTGTGAPGGNGYVVVTKSPLTGALANSFAGGVFPSALKYAGFDMLIFEGKANKPAYLWIDNGAAELRDAQHLWGKTTNETEIAVVAETAPDAKVACIGPAGEKLVRFACIISDMGRAAGRSGVGAVMGSKNLKAVAVRGAKGIKVADSVGFYKAMTDSYEAIATAKNDLLDKPKFEWLHQLGTPQVTVMTHNVLGILPVKNFQTGCFEEVEKLSGELLDDTLSVRKGMGLACQGCPIGCGRVSRVTSPDFAGFGLGPEYETIGAFGSACGVSNLEAVSKANFICNDMGMDTISAGMTIACAMELYERGYLSMRDIGVALNFGDAHAMVEMVRKTASREGFGDILAEGSYRMAEKYGHPELSMSSKKQEFAAYDVRGTQGLGLNYATNPRGADHIRGEMLHIEVYGCNFFRLVKDRGYTAIDPRTTKDKPALAKDLQDFFCVIDSSGMCNFQLLAGINEDGLRILLESATGIDMGGYEGFQKTGERIFNQERLFLLKAGFSAKDDTLPKRMLEEPMPNGPAVGHTCRLGEMLPEYYKLRGWDNQGAPTPEKLQGLGLESH